MSYKKRVAQHHYAELNRQKKIEKQNHAAKSEEAKKFGISKRNIYGIRDLTPYNALLLIDNEDDIDHIVYR